MKRYKCIDGIRGLCMIIMVAGHMINWWLTPEDYWLYLFLESILAPIAASGFLFISGVGTAISYNNNVMRAENTEELNMRKIRNMFMFRALFLFFVSLIYNTAISLALNDLTMIWAWFVLQTIAISLFMVWPFLKTSKIFRIIVGIVLVFINQLILAFLYPYQEQHSFNSLLYHILFNPLDQYPILFYFTIFLIGTVGGEILFDINQLDNQNERETAIKKRFVLPLLVSGSILLIIGIFLSFPSFLIRTTISSQLYSLGMILSTISLLIYNEEFKVIKLKKRYRFFYFYSYYSFTIFLLHNPLYFLFNGKLNVFTIWIAIIITMFLITLLIRFVYKKVGPRASLKVFIGRVSFRLACKIEERKENKFKKDIT